MGYEDVANPDWEAGGEDNAAGGGGWGEGDAAGGAGGDDNWNEPGAAAADGDNWNDPAATEVAPPVPAGGNVCWEGAADDTPAAAGDWAPGAGGAATDAPETSGW